MWIKSFYRIPDSYRIPDKTQAKAELAAALANYRGEITRCAPAVAAAPPGVPAQERRQNAKRQRVAEEAKRQRVAKKRQHRYRKSAPAQ